MGLPPLSGVSGMGLPPLSGVSGMGLPPLSGVSGKKNSNIENAKLIGDFPYHNLAEPQGTTRGNV